MSQAMPPIYTAIEQRKGAIEKMDAAVELATHGDKFIVLKDDAQAELAAEYRAQAQAQIKILDEERLETTKGARMTVDRINRLYNEKINALSAKVKAVDNALKAWMRQKQDEARRQREKLESAQREEQARLEAEARELGVESPPPPPPIVAPPAENPLKMTGAYGANVGQRDNWKYRVVDIAKVPEHLLLPPEERILKSAMQASVKSLIKNRLTKEEDQEAAKSKTYADVIPGIEIYNEPFIASRTL